MARATGDASGAVSGADSVCGAMDASGAMCAAGAVVDLPRRSCAEMKMLWRLLPSEMWWTILDLLDQPTIGDCRKCATIWVAMRRRRTPMPMPTVLMSDQSLLEHGHFAYLARRLISPRTGGRCSSQVVLFRTAWRENSREGVRHALENMDLGAIREEFRAGEGSDGASLTIVRYLLANDPVLEQPSHDLFGTTMENLAGYVGWLGKRDLARKILALLQGASREDVQEVFGALIMGATMNRKLPLIAGISDPIVTAGKPLIGCLDLSPGELLLVKTSLGDVEHTLRALEGEGVQNADIQSCYNLALRCDMNAMALALSPWAGRGGWDGVWPEGKASTLALILSDVENRELAEDRLWQMKVEAIPNALSSAPLVVVNCFGAAARNGALDVMGVIQQWARGAYHCALEDMYTVGLYKAASEGQMNAMRLCRDWGGKVGNDALECAASADFDNSTALDQVIAWGGRFSQSSIFAALEACIWWDEDEGGMCQVENLRVLLRRFDLADEALAQACLMYSFDAAIVAIEFGARCYEQLEQETVNVSREYHVFWTNLNRNIAYSSLAPSTSARASDWLDRVDW